MDLILSALQQADFTAATTTWNISKVTKNMGWNFSVVLKFDQRPLQRQLFTQIVLIADAHDREAVFDKVLQNIYA
ncbi:MAG: hypothetical protein PHS57_01305 [Alphaproteobacteria bacterium]|nr:hypothetical protein [Alphaproteobacteria bacterium]